MSTPKVDRDSGPDGGDRLNVRAGGTIRVFSLGTGGGKIVGSGGTIAAHIADRTGLTVTDGAVVATDVNPWIASMASGVNAAITALRSVGLLATG